MKKESLSYQLSKQINTVLFDAFYRHKEEMTPQDILDALCYMYCSNMIHLSFLNGEDKQVCIGNIDRAMREMVHITWADYARDWKTKNE